MHHHCHRTFREPSIPVLDEPSAGLDPQARRILINLLCELPITMLLSTHDIRLVLPLCSNLSQSFPFIAELVITQ